MRARDWIEARQRELVDLDVFDLVARFTLIYLLSNPVTIWWLRVPVLALAAWGLISQRAVRSRALWLGMTALLTLRVGVQWWTCDNHIFLLTYWCGALLVAALLRGDEGERALFLNARLLIGLAFLFAVLWKAVLAPDFRSGEFFRGTFLTDVRFRDLSLMVGSQTPQDYAFNMRQLRHLRQADEGRRVEIREPDRQKRIARLVTWWTLVSEAWVAVAFLVSPRSWLGRLRHVSLMLFCWTTYAFASVLGFGWLLVILGAAQTRAENGWARLAYLLTFIVVLVHQFAPWTTYLARTVG